MKKNKLLFWLLTVSAIAIAGLWIYAQLIENTEINIKDFGAIENDGRDDQSAIQEAINHAEHDGVEIVYIPEGEFQVNSSIHVGNNLTLKLDEKAVIVRNYTGKGSANATIRNKKFSDNGNQNIKITGGTIKAANVTNKGMHLAFWGVTNLEVDNVKIRGTHGDWSTIFRKTKQVKLHRLDIDTLTDELYSDGIHFVGGKDIEVTECRVTSADDSIALTIENEHDGSIEDVTISNCTLTSRRASVLKIMTTEQTTDEISNVTISDITGVGGTVEAGQAIFFEDRSGQKRIKNINLENINIDASRGAGYGAFIDHLSGLKMNNVNIQKSEGTGLVLLNSNYIYISDSSFVNPRSENANGITIENSSDIEVMNTLIDNPSKYGIVINEANGPVVNLQIKDSEVIRNNLADLIIFREDNIQQWEEIESGINF